MGKKLVAFAMVAALALMLVGCGGSGAGSSKNSNDSVIMHEVYCTDTGDGYIDYQIVYYKSNSHVLKAVAALTQFEKVEGLTREYLETFDYDTIFPNLSKLAFASKDIYDDGDYYTIIIRFNDLDVKQNIQQLHDNGILELIDRNVDNVDADSLMSLMESEGAQKISSADYEKLGLVGYL